MAIAVDAQTQIASDTGGTSFSLNHTCSGSDRLLLVIIHAMRGTAGGVTISSATWGGAAMSLADTYEYADTGGSRTHRLSVYYVINPGTSQATVAVTTLNAVLSTVITAISLTGVHQTTAIGNTNKNTFSVTQSFTLDVATSANSWLFGFAQARNGNTTWTPGTNVTERYDTPSGTSATDDLGTFGGYKSPAADTNTVNATPSANRTGVMVAVEVKAAATSQTITASSVATLEAFGGLTAAPGAVTVAVGAGVATAVSVPNPTATPGAVTVAVSAGVATAAAVSQPAVMTPVTVAAGSVATAESVPGPALTTGAVTVEAESVATAEAFGAVAVAPGAVTLAPTEIPSDENVNGVDLSLGAAAISPDSIATGESVPEPVVRRLLLEFPQDVGDNDSNENSAGSVLLGNAEVVIDNTRPYGAFLFPNLPIPAGATVTSATIRLYLTTSANPNLTIRAEANVSPAALAATTNNISARSLTTNGVNWVGSNIGINQYKTSPDFAAVVQEVVNLPGWEENTGDLLIVLSYLGTGYFRYNTANAAADHPVLAIQFETGAFEQSVTAPGLASAEAFGEAALSVGSVTVAVDESIATEEAVAEPALVIQQFVTPPALGSVVAFGEAEVSQGGPVITVVDGIASETVWGDAGLGLVVYAEGATTGESVPEPQVLPGAATLAPPAIATEEAIGAAAVTATVAVTPDGIASAEAIGTAAVTPAPWDIFAASIGSGENFEEPVVSVGALVLSAEAIASGEGFGLLVVAVGPVSIAPAGIPTAESVPAPGLSLVTAITPEGIPTAESVPDAALSAVVTVAPDGLPTAEMFGDVALMVSVTVIVGDGIITAESVPGVTVTAGAVVLSPEAIASLEAFGLASFGAAAWEIAPDGMASLEAFGAAAVGVGAVVVAPDGIASAETFGVAWLLARFLPALNVWLIPAKTRVYTLPVKARVWRVGE